MRATSLLLIALLTAWLVTAPAITACWAFQESTTTIGVVDTVLTLPADVASPPLAVLVAGSGAINHDGNSPHAKPNTLRKLSEALVKHGIATLRYDKRSTPWWKAEFGHPDDFRFHHFVDDAVMIVDTLRARNAFSRIVLIGHSEGALVAMLAATRAQVDGVVLLTATARKQGDLLKEQLRPKLDAATFARVEQILDDVTAGKIVTDIPAGMKLPPAAQPGLASAFVEDPLVPLRKLSIPVLIIGGGRDIQIPRKDFDDLSAAAPNAHILWLNSMNHVLVDITDADDNMKSYTQADRALNAQLLDAITRFVKSKSAN